jgi:hypothetical protein
MTLVVQRIAEYYASASPVISRSDFDYFLAIHHPNIELSKPKVRVLVVHCGAEVELLQGLESGLIDREILRSCDSFLPPLA